MGGGFNPIYGKPILSSNCIAMPTCPFICMNGHVGTAMPVFGRPKSLMGNGQEQPLDKTGNNSSLLLN